jgi:hypothetical protein
MMILLFCVSTDADCDAIVGTDDEINATIETQISNCLDTIVDTTNECEPSINASNDINCKSRRKSNRISKPIQRSLDLSPNQPVITIKKIGILFF